MSAQSTPAISQSASVSEAFKEADKQKLLQVLLKDVIDLRNVVDDLAARYNAMVALYNAHTHAADGAQGGDYITGTPVTDETTATVQAGTPSTAVASAVPATVKATV